LKIAPLTGIAASVCRGVKQILIKQIDQVHSDLNPILAKQAYLNIFQSRNESVYNTAGA
jgi:hypothetical protein